MHNLVTKVSDLYDNVKEISKQKDNRFTNLRRQVRVAAAVLHQKKIDIGQFIKFQGYVHKVTIKLYEVTAREIASELKLQPPVTRTVSTAKIPALTTFGQQFPELSSLITK